MKDIYELIRQKEADVERIGREIEALRLSARLLEESDRSTTAPSASASSPTTPNYNPAPSRPQPSPTPTPAAWASAKQFP